MKGGSETERAIGAEAPKDRECANKDSKCK